MAMGIAFVEMQDKENYDHIEKQRIQQQPLQHQPTPKFSFQFSFFFLGTEQNPSTNQENKSTNTTNKN